MIEWPEWLRGRVPLVSVEISTGASTFISASVEALLWASDPVRYSAMMQDHVERKVLEQGDTLLTPEWYLAGGLSFDYPDGLAIEEDT